MVDKRSIVDMHCDTISRLWHCRAEGRESSLRTNDGHLDLLRMKDSGYLLQNFALFVHKESCGNPWDHVMELLAVYEEELALNSDLLAPVRRYEDIADNARAGKMSALLTVEEGAVCMGEIEKLRILCDKGVRMITLTWNYPNELGYPNLDSIKGREIRQQAMAHPELVNPYLNTANTTDGLTEMGRMFVEEMERLGIIPDVSHLSDAGFYDVLECSRKPFVASHSNARAVCPCVRNMTDEMIRALAERGGVMGLNFCADFLVQQAPGVHNPGTIEDIVRHARHIANVGGMEVLGLGSDFDGIDTHEELVGVQGMEKLFDRLVKGGFTENQVEKIFSGNVLRVYKDCIN